MMDALEHGLPSIWPKPDHGRLRQYGYAAALSRSVFGEVIPSNQKRNVLLGAGAVGVCALIIPWNFRCF
jgi:acyl-CoA reductase-like NAD-dependent aldehyde dehydrogenase